jgi:peptide chain release factor 2
MRKLKELKNWVTGYQEVKTAADELELAYDFFREGVIEEQELDETYRRALELIEQLEMNNMLSHEEDQLGAVLKIVAGAGGTEAQDWAEMLLRMYQRWAERKGYKWEITTFQPGDEAGIKSVTIQIEGERAYGYLKSENGVHRLVRVSPFNAQGKRMTSFTSVFVVPLIDDSIEIEINPANLSWDTFRSSGAGGQNVNKVETGVRLHYTFKHPVTGEQSEIVIKTPKAAPNLITRTTHCVYSSRNFTNLNFRNAALNRKRLNRPKRKLNGVRRFAVMFSTTEG